MIREELAKLPHTAISFFTSVTSERAHLVPIFLAMKENSPQNEPFSVHFAGNEL